MISFIIVVAVVVSTGSGIDGFHSVGNVPGFSFDVVVLVVDDGDKKCLRSHNR